MTRPPILADQHSGAASVFKPHALPRGSRRQKAPGAGDVPPVCLPDPDGSLARRPRRDGPPRPCPAWACDHTELDRFRLGDREVGIVGRAVGAPHLGVVGRAWRDDGTSDHDPPPSDHAEAGPALVQGALLALDALPGRGFAGASWTTDASYRDTEAAIAAARARGVLAVEMEAAALCAFAPARRVLCLAHVTNTVGSAGDDFEKGAVVEAPCGAITRDNGRGTSARSARRRPRSRWWARSRRRA